MNDEQNFKPMSRRNFLHFAALGAGTLVAVTIAGQAKASPGLATNLAAAVTPVKPVKKLTSTIANNHGHAFVMTLENLKKNAALSYNISGTASHPHVVRLQII